MNIETQTQNPVVYFTKMLPSAKVPEFKSEIAAGMDVYPLSSFVIHPGKTVSVKTGVSVRIPDGCYGRLAPRSSLSRDHGISVEGGVIDRDYNGELIVLVHNKSDKMYAYDLTSDPKRDFRICQLIVEKIERPEIKVVNTLPQVNSSRAGGFGSTN